MKFQVTALNTYGEIITRKEKKKKKSGWAWRDCITIEESLNYMLPQRLKQYPKPCSIASLPPNILVIPSFPKSVAEQALRSHFI